MWKFSMGGKVFVVVGVGINLFIIFLVASVSEAFVIIPSIVKSNAKYHQRNAVNNDDDSWMTTLPSTTTSTTSNEKRNGYHHDALSSASSSASKFKSRIIQAASMATQQSCPILGIKSLGVDYGLVRTGIAVTVGYNPTPLAIVSDYLNNTELCKRVVNICRAEKSVDRVIVGLPLHKNGTEAEQTNLTRVFAKELAIHVVQELGPNVPVQLWDERYTSKEAAARIHSQDPNRHLYGTIDDEAACIILEHYYNDNGDRAELVPVPIEFKEQYTRLWQERQSQQEQRLQEIQKEREAKLQRRKEIMEMDQRRTVEESSSLFDTLTTSTTSDSTVSSNGKKKKKKKQKRK